MVHFADEKRELDFMRRDNFKWKDVEGTREGEGVYNEEEI